MRKLLGLGLAVAVASSLVARPAVAHDVGGLGLKLIILDKLAAASKAKMVFVAKHVFAHQGAGTDPSDVHAQLDIFGTTAPGSFVMPQGANWLVNNGTVVKYVNKPAPTGGAVKVSVLKAAKLIKVVAKSLGDTPVDISAPSPGGVDVVYTITNGGEEHRFCTHFVFCDHKVIAGGGNYKLICKGNSHFITCPNSPSGAFVD